MTTQWTIKVWWCDGRVTEHTTESRAKALDVVSGECHPFERYELTGGLVTADRPEVRADFLERMSMASKHRSIESALYSREIRMALNGLAGCPVGGWGATVQAIRQLDGALPIRQERDYTRSELIDHCMKIEGEDLQSSGRYAWRPEVVARLPR